MLDTESYLRLDATEQQQLLRQRATSSRHLVEHAIARIEQTNPHVNAVVTKCFDRALQRAQQADALASQGQWWGPLHGIPILIKDLFDFLPGVRNTFGCEALVDFVPDVSSAHVQRLEDAGAIILGKTNTPVFGHKGLTDNRLFGPTRCPFDLTRNAGGSSGGSAAAVAVGMVPLAQGSDAGGSVRIPAAWCGVVGFKPTFGRIPNTGGANAFGTHTPFVHVGSLTRSVRDAALMTQAMIGPHADDPFSLPDDRLDLVAAAQNELATPRIAFSPDLGVYAVEPAVARVVESCVQQLRAAGVAIETAELKLPLSQSELADLWRRQVGVVYTDLFAALAAQGLDLPRDQPACLPEEIHRMLRQAQAETVLSIKRDEAARTLVWREVQQWFLRYDLILTPTVAATPVKNAENGTTLGPRQVGGSAVEPTIGWCLTHPFNFTGHPAASVPAGWTVDGLPVGLQIVGRRFRDDDVIALCRTVERVCPWTETVPRAAANIGHPTV